jgi:hypothetical protein
LPVRRHGNGIKCKLLIKIQQTSTNVRRLGSNGQKTEETAKMQYGKRIEGINIFYPSNVKDNLSIIIFDLLKVEPHLLTVSSHPATATMNYSIVTLIF